MAASQRVAIDLPILDGPPADVHLLVGKAELHRYELDCAKRINPLLHPVLLSISTFPVSLPARERGLKLSYPSKILIGIESLPARERGLKRPPADSATLACACGVPVNPGGCRMAFCNLAGGKSI